MWHLILHCLGLNRGNPETFWDGDKLMVGFRCTCGVLSQVEWTGKTRSSWPGKTVDLERAADIYKDTEPLDDLFECYPDCAPPLRLPGVHYNAKGWPIPGRKGWDDNNANEVRARLLACEATNSPAFEKWRREAFDYAMREMERQMKNG